MPNSIGAGYPDPTDPEQTEIWLRLDPPGTARRGAISRRFPWQKQLTLSWQTTVEAVDDAAGYDHLGGGEVFQGLALGGVVGLDASVDPDAQEDLGFGGLDRAAYGRVGLLPSGEGVDLVGVEDVEARGDGVRVGWDVPQEEYAAGVGVGRAWSRAVSVWWRVQDRAAARAPAVRGRPRTRAR
ncbi:hypothetical protein OG365_40990 (plasmid) [Streptomyces sp. NBC_00853]|uniref:hypothetical protein n=1 Tax=Streptomyces sp. NBC_00853 TaxID=2903681 RepID=UPI003872C2D2|nr:hypothetical protein OG365_40990 [Streptomyces sp. NBC_00853]